MNLFKKIGAAILASALALTTAVTASADTTKDSLTSKGSIKVGAYTSTLDDGREVASFYVTGLPSQYKECDGVIVEFSLYGAFESDSEAGYVLGQSTNIVINGLVSPSTYTGMAVLSRSSDPNTALSTTNNVLFGLNADDGSYVIKVDYYDNELYYDELVGGNNFIIANIYGYKDGKYFSYNEDGSMSSDKQVVYSLLSDLYKKPTSSEGSTSEPSTSEPTTSEPTTSEPTTSEPTTSKPTTSESTTSEPTASKPVSSETSSEASKAEPSDTTNPATGVTAIVIGAITIAGACTIATTRRKKK